MKTSESMKMFLLGLVVALLAVIALRSDSGVATAADSGGSGNLVALAQSSKNAAMLFLVDMQTRHIAVYMAEDNKFAFQAARSFRYDLGITEADGRKISVADAKKLYDRSREEDAKSR